jgi:cytochrome c oxidase subunit 1
MMLMRWQLAYPGAALPLLGTILGEARMPGGTMLPDFYNELGAMHGTIMVFLGRRAPRRRRIRELRRPAPNRSPDMAFPRLNMASYSLLPGRLIMFASFFVPGGAAQGGWTSYTPSPVIAAGSGQTWWLIGMIFLITSSLLGAVNFITTIIQLRGKGLTFMRFPFFVWAQLVTGLPPAPGLPAARGGGVLQLMDRPGGTSFFLPDRPRRQRPGPPDGRRRQPDLWQHLFWFLAHPEVYVLILPRWASWPRSSRTTRGSPCGATGRWSTRSSSSASCRSSCGRTTCS